MTSRRNYRLEPTATEGFRDAARRVRERRVGVLANELRSPTRLPTDRDLALPAIGRRAKELPR
jgi:hypothetical protein